MAGTEIVALVARGAAIQKTGLTHDDLYHVHVALGRKLHAGTTKHGELVLFCYGCSENRKLRVFGALTSEFREQRINPELNDITEIEIRKGFDPIFPS